MAEFSEVMRQAARMCRSFGASCDGCKLHWFDGETLCLLGGTPETWHDSKMQDAERIVMEWAAEHPEPRYPSWHEAWNKLFREACGGVPCPKYFISEKRYDEMCIGNDCECCLESPIPADIAEKLGIKPIGGQE